MSSFYDDASLVVIPSGYKTSKVYAEKPTDGSGDLAFTRTGDTATRVGPDGLIQRVRTNLVLYSNDFSNAAWGKNNATLTGGQSGYDGTNNAFSITGTGGNNDKIIQGVSTTGLITASVYAKAGNVNFIIVTIGGVATWFNLSSGAVGTNISALNPKIESVGNGYYRCSISVVNASSTNFELYLATSDGNTNTAAGNYILLQNSQVETGDIATPYIPTTTAAVSVGPVANVPRLDYLGSTCPRLLLEPQRTNSALFSEQINNAAWGKLNVTVSANQAVGPDGTTSADLVYPTTTGVDRVIEQLPVAVIGQTWTSSFFVKASGFSWVLIYAPNLVTCWFNASTGVFGTIGAGATATVLGQVNGYWRISLTGTVASSNAYLYVGPADANGTTTATANGTNGILIWGCQLEQGAYATSYIPTLGASATRGEDACSKTGISSLIGQTEGTVFFDFTFDTVSGQTNDPVLWYMKDGGAGERYIQLFDDGRLIYIEFNGAVIANITKTGVTAGRHKCAVAYANNDMVLYVDGVQAGTDTSGTPSGFSTFGIQYYSTIFNGQQKVNQALVFKTRLTNAQMQELTTL